MDGKEVTPTPPVLHPRWGMEAGKASRRQGKLPGGGEPNEEISKLVHSHPSPTIRNSRRLAEHQSSCFLVKNVLSRGSLHILYMSLCHRRMNEGEAYMGICHYALRLNHMPHHPISIKEGR